MKAVLEPLGGKYYGTEVAIISTDPKFSDGVIQIWINGNYEPSRRELEGYVKKEDGKWYQTDEDGFEWEYEISDSHYETETSLEIAELLVEAVNNAN